MRGEFLFQKRLMLSCEVNECKPLLRGRPAPRQRGRQPRAPPVRHHGRAVQAEPMKPVLKTPRAQHLKLKYDEPLSNFGFNSNLRRYIMGDEKCMAGRPGTDWFALRSACAREEVGPDSRWCHEPPIPGTFINMLQHKRMMAASVPKAAIGGANGVVGEKTDGLCVGAAAFVPAAIIAATAGAYTRSHQFIVNALV